MTERTLKIELIFHQTKGANLQLWFGATLTEGF